MRRGALALIVLCSSGLGAAEPPPPDASPPPESPAAVFHERLSVALRTWIVRVLDADDRPVLGLGPDDFRVSIEGAPIPVLAADWVGEQAPPSIRWGPAAATATTAPVAAATPREGQLVVVFLQPDTNAIRMKGHLRIQPLLQDLLRSLPAADRVAVVSYDSHLKLFLDFTADRGAAAAAVDRAFRFAAVPGARRRAPALLADHLDARRAAAAATPERALRLVAEALSEIPGVKSMIFVGWGLGGVHFGRYQMGTDYERAVDALRRGGTAVFVLDVTDADMHTLEFGVEKIAADTGGTYARTAKFAARAIRRLGHALTGYYVLSLGAEAIPAGTHPIAVELRDGTARVLTEPDITGPTS